MNSLHDIHSCSKISAVNVELRRRLCLMKNKNEDLQRQVDDLLDEKRTNMENNVKKSFRNSSMQTDSKPLMFRHLRESPTRLHDKKVIDSDIAKTNKVLEMHAQLLKRYDKEVKLNMDYADTISELNVKLSESEKNLRLEKDKLIRLEQELFVTQQNSEERSKSAGKVEDPVLRDVLEEKNKLSKENTHLRKELKGLDHNFFDEIEDIKFALLKSAKLNTTYEKYLQDLCTRFNVPCPVKGLVNKKR